MVDEKIATSAFLRIEGPIVKPRNRNDGGTIHYSLYVDATTFVIKAELFHVSLKFCPKIKLKEFFELAAIAASQNAKSFLGIVAFVIVNIDNAQGGGKPSLDRPTIADGNSPSDCATVSFLFPSRFPCALF